MIKVKDLCFSYKKGQKVLDHINLHIKKGEFIAILGHNGSGKSTLSKHFNALLIPQSGEVAVDGIDTRDEDRVLDIRQRVGMVFQNPDNQIVSAVVEEDVAFAAENLGVPSDEIRRRVDWALSVVELSGFKQYAPHLLSGGQKQKVAIAGVLAMRPECIVLDEPTAMLDPRGRKEVMATLKRLNDEGITVVLVTHNMDEAVKCDRVVVMEDGQIILDGEPHDIFGNVSRIKEIGLDVPQVTELLYELGMQPVLTVDESVKVLEKAIGKDA